MDKVNTVHTTQYANYSYPMEYYLFNSEKQWNPVTYDNINGIRDYYQMKYNRHRRTIQYNFTCKWSLKRKSDKY